MLPIKIISQSRSIESQSDVRRRTPINMFIGLKIISTGSTSIEVTIVLVRKLSLVADCDGP